jgi:hypothetical protein
MRSVSWADIPALSTRGRYCPPSWQQYWQQLRRSGADPRPFAIKAGHIPKSGSGVQGEGPLPSLLRCLELGGRRRMQV